ncbi:MMPL family transporter [Dactylosporangium sp. CA-233914]|uniref:MMPL family transporter n=1 Tax=Dactylosporangium sp. CA-233914 TaxID=3239934 RepID=UPI003D8AEF7D
MMDTIARFVLKHRKLIIGFWIVVMMAGGVAAALVQDRLSSDFSLPGQEGSRAETKLIETYGVGPEPQSVPVLTAPAGQRIADHRADIAAVADRIRAVPGTHVVDYASTGDAGFLTTDGRSTFLLVYAPEAAPGEEGADPVIATAVREAAAEHGLTSSITGMNQLAAGNADDGEGLNLLTETLLGAGGALLVLLFVFASLLALVPLMVAAVAILATFLAVLAVTTFADVSFVVDFLIALVGLGVAIDYSLLVVTRWREERAHGATNDEAVATAVRTAGHAVVTSGATVAISLLALLVVDMPAVRSIGYGGMLIPLVSTLVVLTLLPALLSLAGPRLDWPTLRKEATASRGWTAWARGVVRFRWIAAGVALTALALAVAPVFGIQVGQPDSSALASRGAAHDALTTLTDGGIGSGVLTPMSLLVDPGRDVQALATAASQAEGVRMAVVMPPGDGGVRQIIVVPERETVDITSIQVVTAVRDATRELPGYGGVTGTGAAVLDWQNAVYKIFPWVLVLIAAVTYILLVRTFRSLLLPLKAVLLNLLSVAAVFGLTTWFWQDGHGSALLFDIQATRAITFWLPVLIFAFLFGLSMDYEVFILARLREEYDRTGSTTTAIEQGLGRTGRLVTSAALILFFAFTALASAPGADIKILATALGAGILLDATIVRALLVPALVSLLGKYNWWLPANVARLLRVEPSPLTNEPAAPDRESLSVS